MNIAHIIPHSITYPLRTHNGRYDWVKQLASLQVKQGHTVTIYGNPASRIEGVSFAGIDHTLDTTRQNNLETFRLAFAHEHDVYHSHFDDLHYEVATETARPIVFTQHWWPTDRLLHYARTKKAPNVWAVPPTQYMYDFDKDSGVQSKGFIYHGIDMQKFNYSGASKNGRLLFVGRISPEKNLDIAISVAKKANRGLDIIGKVAPKNQLYWENLQEDVDGVQIRYLGPKNQEELIEYYSAATGVLAPFEPTEPFGLVSIEAQACGTPIIMKRGGSRAELLEGGKTGFLCTTEDEFVVAIQKLDTIDPQDCRAYAHKFNVVDMADSYTRLYTEVV